MLHCSWFCINLPKFSSSMLLIENELETTRVICCKGVLYECLSNLQLLSLKQFLKMCWKRSSGVSNAVGREMNYKQLENKTWASL